MTVRNGKTPLTLMHHELIYSHFMSGKLGTLMPAEERGYFEDIIFIESH